ncbi:MAG: SAM-dependent methyltransferase [Cyclobacteriaceae bacterium]
MSLVNNSISERLQQLTSAGFTAFVNANEAANVNQLLLGKAPDGIDLKLAADQILSRRKAKDKLPTWHQTNGLILPPPLSIEQSSSERTAEYKRSILKGKHLVDLTGGMGVDLLTLSSQFDKATHVEMDEWLSVVFRHNAKVLTEKPIETFNQKAEDYLKTFDGKATFFIDPARRDSHKKKVFLFEDCSPNVIELMPQFRAKAKQVLIKAAPMIDITLGIKQLSFVKEVHVVSLNNECKEILFLLDFGFTEQATIHCINLKSDTEELLSFDLSGEKDTEVNYTSPQSYIYEPNASIRKAGAFRSVAASFGLSKIAPNTHLYTSEELINNFPGRIFKTLGGVDKKNIKVHFPEGKANVISKNYPLTPEQIKKKFKLKDGGERFLIAFRNEKNGTDLLSCLKID